MGGWQLEVFRMAVYISFPVGLFYFFNQPSFFEGWMMEKRARLFPPQDPNANKILEDFKEQQELRRENKMIAAYNAAKKESS